MSRIRMCGRDVRGGVGPGGPLPTGIIVSEKKEELRVVFASVHRARRMPTMQIVEISTNSQISDRFQGGGGL
jgi:hypothetical protein